MTLKLDPLTGLLGKQFVEKASAIVRALRVGRGWSQQNLAQRACTSQSAVSRIERAVASSCRGDVLGRIFAALGVRSEILTSGPAVLDPPPQRDRTHAWLLAYVERRLRRIGWLVQREVPIGGGHVLGWIDLLAWNPVTGVLMVIEAKSTLNDLGALERQVGWYEKAAWDVSLAFGWHPNHVVVLVAALASGENLAFCQANGPALRARFPVEPARFERLLASPASEWPRIARALAFVDPRRKARGWLLPAGVHAGRPITGADRTDDRARQPRRPASQM